MVGMTRDDKLIMGQGRPAGLEPGPKKAQAQPVKMVGISALF